MNDFDQVFYKKNIMEKKRRITVIIFKPFHFFEGKLELLYLNFDGFKRKKKLVINELKDELTYWNKSSVL